MLWHGSSLAPLLWRGRVYRGVQRCEDIVPRSQPAVVLPLAVQEGLSSSEGRLLFHQGNGMYFKLASIFT